VPGGTKDISSEAFTDSEGLVGNPEFETCGCGFANQAHLTLVFHESSRPTWNSVLRRPDETWPPKYLRSRERQENRGWKSWVQQRVQEGPFIGIWTRADRWTQMSANGHGCHPIFSPPVGLAPSSSF
jgi:hypothetical protein